MKSVLLAVVCVAVCCVFVQHGVQAAPSWSFGAATNVVVNVYPSGFLDHTDCFVSSCDHDVSIVQDADPVFGQCGSYCKLGHTQRESRIFERV